MVNCIFLLFLFSVQALVILNAHQLDSFTLGIRDSIMIAHSFRGEEFGPAQNMHGATYTVDVEFTSPEIAEKLNWVRGIVSIELFLAGMKRSFR